MGEISLESGIFPAIYFSGLPQRQDPGLSGGGHQVTAGITSFRGGRWAGGWHRVCRRAAVEEAGDASTREQLSGKKPPREGCHRPQAPRALTASMPLLFLWRFWAQSDPWQQLPERGRATGCRDRTVMHRDDDRPSAVGPLAQK